MSKYTDLTNDDIRAFIEKRLGTDDPLITEEFIKMMVERRNAARKRELYLQTRNRPDDNTFAASVGFGIVVILSVISLSFMYTGHSHL